jgi:hypothetical protein
VPDLFLEKTAIATFLILSDMAPEIDALQASCAKPRVLRQGMMNGQPT